MIVKPQAWNKCSSGLWTFSLCFGAFRGWMWTESGGFGTLDGGKRSGRGSDRPRPGLSNSVSKVPAHPAMRFCPVPVPPPSPGSGLWWVVCVLAGCGCRPGPSPSWCPSPVKSAASLSSGPHGDGRRCAGRFRLLSYYKTSCRTCFWYGLQDLNLVCGPDARRDPGSAGGRQGAERDRRSTAPALIQYGKAWKACTGGARDDLSRQENAPRQDAGGPQNGGIQR